MSKITCSKPRGATETQLLEWANQEMVRGVPRQVVCDALLNQAFEWKGFDPPPFSLVENRLFAVMVERIDKGIDLEKAGKIDEAIKVYEENVADRFKGTFPYERLRVLYAKRKDYLNAIRVCQAYLDLPYPAADKPQAYKFKDNLVKLRLKQAKSSKIP